MFLKSKINPDEKPPIVSHKKIRGWERLSNNII